MTVNITIKCPTNYVDKSAAWKNTFTAQIIHFSNYSAKKDGK